MLGAVQTHTRVPASKSKPSKQRVGVRGTTYKSSAKGMTLVPCLFMEEDASGFRGNKGVWRMVNGRKGNSKTGEESGG